MVGLVIGAAIGLAGFVLGSGLESTEKGKKLDNTMKKNLNEWNSLKGKNKPFIEDKSDKKLLK